MKSKTINTIYIAVILLICLVPSVGMLIFGAEGSGSNEILASPPALTTAEGSFNAAFLSDTSDFVQDRFFLRQELIGANSGVCAGIFSTSASSKVILGSNGWLFYSDTLDDYTGQDPLTDREIYCAANNVSILNDYFKSAGSKFVFTIAPNKNSLYTQNMPEYAIISSAKNSDRLKTALEGMGVNYADLFTVFKNCADTVYFRQDSHWNGRGAAMAADAVIESLGLESSYSGEKFVRADDHVGDLYKMLYPVGKAAEEDYTVAGGLSFDYTGEGRLPTAVMLKTHGGGSESLYMFRDSFGNSLYPYMGDFFGDASFSRAAQYDATKAVGADCVAIELVERNIDYLLDYLPIAPAQQVQVSESVKKSESAARVSLTADDKIPGYVLAQGNLTVEPDGDSPVFILCDGTAYKAFLGRNGEFAARLPETCAQGHISILFGQNGQYMETDII